jgi:hypothetical protein
MTTALLAMGHGVPAAAEAATGIYALPWGPKLITAVVCVLIAGIMKVIEKGTNSSLCGLLSSMFGFGGIVALLSVLF